MNPSDRLSSVVDASSFQYIVGVDVGMESWVLLQKFLSSSKRNVFYHRAKVKRVKDVPIFSRRICFCSNYTLIFDELKNFCNRTRYDTLPLFQPGSGHSRFFAI